MSSRTMPTYLKSAFSTLPVVVSPALGIYDLEQNFSDSKYYNPKIVPAPYILIDTICNHFHVHTSPLYPRDQLDLENIASICNLLPSQVYDFLRFNDVLNERKMQAVRLLADKIIEAEHTRDYSNLVVFKYISSYNPSVYYPYNARGFMDMEVYESTTPDNLTDASDDEISASSLSSSPGSSEYKDTSNRICWRYLTREGCKYGETCKHRHVQPTIPCTSSYNCKNPRCTFKHEGREFLPSYGSKEYKSMVRSPKKVKLTKKLSKEYINWLRDKIYNLYTNNVDEIIIKEELIKATKNSTVHINFWKDLISIHEQYRDTSGDLYEYIIDMHSKSEYEH